MKNYPEDGHGAMLDRYGALLHSLSHSADASSVTIGFGQPHAAYGEYGTRHLRHGGLLAANPESSTLGPEDAESILDIVHEYLRES